MRFLTKIILTVLVLGATLFAGDVATITGLNGQAFVDRDGSKVALNTGDKLQAKDTIITDAKSKVQIVFSDETVVTVGSDSMFSIDEYLYEENQEPVAKFGMLKGAMRTITGGIGKIAPEKFSVATKTATIGIRGTNFSIIIDEDDTNNIFCTYGAISVEFDGIEHMVRQGFYLTLDMGGNVNINEFTPKILQNMTEKGFGKSVPKEGEVSNEAMMDNTKEYTGELVVKELTTAVETAKHAYVADEVGENDDHPHYDPDYKPYYPEPTPTPTPTPIPTPTPTPIPTPIVADPGIYMGHLSGHYDIFGVSAFVIMPDGSFSEESAFYFSDLDDGGMELALSIVPPVGYASKENFSTSLAVLPDSTDASSATLYSSSYVATGDDLADGDYMTWGSWSVDGSYYDPQNNYAKVIVKIPDGLWVAGQATPAEVVANRVGIANYSGIYRAVDYMNNSAIVNGVATAQVDFGADTAILNIDYNGGVRFDMVLNANIIGTPTDQGNHAMGMFYGPNVDSIGGVFYTEIGESKNLQGVYQVNKIIAH